MRRISQIFSRILILIFVISSLIIVKPENTSAQITTPTPIVTPSSNPTSSPTPTPITTLMPIPTIVYPKPIIPEFTVNLISLLPEANKSIIELIIKNQPFNRNVTYTFFLNVRTKTNDGNWREIYTPEDGYPTQSSSNYTVLSFSSSSEYDGYFTATTYPYNDIITAPNSRVDFQVQAMIGSRHRGPFSVGIMPYVFEGETSGWSNTQTITLSDRLSTTISTVSPSQNITLTPFQSDSKTAVLLGFNWVQVITLVLLGTIVFVLIIVVVFLGKRNKE